MDCLSVQSAFTTVVALALVLVTDLSDLSELLFLINAMTSIILALNPTHLLAAALSSRAIDYFSVESASTTVMALSRVLVFLKFVNFT